jgi:hypothetical protein
MMVPSRHGVGYNALMKTKTATPSCEGAIWARIVDPFSGDLTTASARSLLDLDFKRDDLLRMEELADKAGAGTLTRRERREAEIYNRVAHLLALLQSKARQSLLQRKRR